MNNERVVLSFSQQAIQQLRQLRTGTASGAAKEKDTEAKNAKNLQDGFRRVETAIGRLAIGIGASTAALSGRGFQGTADAAKLSFAMDRLAGQVAAVFQPVIQAMTYGAHRLANIMARMTSVHQDRLLAGGIGGAIGTGLGYMLGGPMGAVGFASMAMGAASRSPMLAAAGSAALGFKVGGPVGALVFGTAGAATAAAPIMAGGELPFAYYDRMRAGGASKFGAAFGMVAAAIRRTVMLGHDPTLSAEAAAEDGKPGKRREAPLRFNPAEVEAGETARRIQEAVMLASAGAEGDGGPLQPVVDILIKIFEFLVVQSGGTLLPEPPPPARGRAW